MSPRIRAAAVLALLLVASCGWSETLDAPGPTDDAGRWHPAPSECSRYAPWGLPRNRGETLELPEAEHVQTDREDRLPRLVLNVLGSGNVLFKGKEWHWSTGVEQERRAARTAVRNELQRLCADPQRRDEQGVSLLSVMLHADRRAPWSAARDVVPILQEPEIRIRRLHVAVSKPRRDFAARSVDYRLGAVLTPIPDAEQEARPLVVRIGTSPAPDGTRLEVAGRSWSFGGVDEGFTDPGFLARANAIWDEVEAWLPEAAGGLSSARIEMVEGGDDVRLAYVVTTLDLLLGAGIRDVSLPDAGVRLQLDEPDETLPVAYRDDPVVSAWMVLGCLLAVLVAFGITPLYLRRRRKP